MKVINRQIKVALLKEKVNVTYFIKPEERKIIAVCRFSMPMKKGEESILNDPDIVILNSMKIMESSGAFLCFNDSAYKRLTMSKCYKSIATCDPEDTWDEAVGMEVVNYKITQKLNTAVINRFAYIQDILAKGINFIANKLADDMSK